MISLRIRVWRLIIGRITRDTQLSALANWGLSLGIFATSQMKFLFYLIFTLALLVHFHGTRRVTSESYAYGLPKKHRRSVYPPPFVLCGVAVCVCVE